MVRMFVARHSLYRYSGSASEWSKIYFSSSLFTFLLLTTFFYYNLDNIDNFFFFRQYFCL